MVYGTNFIQCICTGYCESWILCQPSFNLNSYCQLLQCMCKYNIVSICECKIILVKVILYDYVYRRPSGTDEEFFVQLFVEPDKSMAMPTTELLLIKMFKEQNITFAKVWFVVLVVFL